MNQIKGTTVNRINFLKEYNKLQTELLMPGWKARSELTWALAGSGASQL